MDVRVDDEKKETMIPMRAHIYASLSQISRLCAVLLGKKEMKQPQDKKFVRRARHCIVGRNAENTVDRCLVSGID